MLKSTNTVRSTGGGERAPPQNQLKSIRQQATATSVRTGGVSSSHVSSAKQKILEKQKNLPRIIDEQGNDVTPKPLFDVEILSKPRHASSLFHSLEGTSTPTDLLSTGSILGTNIILTGGQSFAGMPENTSTTHISTDSMQQHTDSLTDGAASEKDKETSAQFLTTIEKKKQIDSLERIKIKETATFYLLDIVATCFSNEDTHIEKIKQKNDKYVELCKSKVGNDSFAERAMNTFNNLPKVKSTQTERITIHEKGIYASVSDMYDSFAGTAVNDAEKPAKDTELESKAVDATSRPISVTSASKVSMSNRATVVSESSAVVSVHPDENVKQVPTNTDYHNSESFKLNAFFMERLLNQNTYQPKQAKYRGIQPATPGHQEVAIKTPTQQYDGPSLDKLWNYSCNLTKDRNISCLAWNTRNKDLLAVGYGKFEYNDDTTGVVCCWCLKNPEFPERVYKTEAGVTAVSFSHKHANLLAVGLFNGNILIFDTRNNNSAPLISTNETESKHLSPVWQLKWMDRERSSNSNSNTHSEEEEMEVIMSVSTDGRVSQWMIRKGFESTDYIKLKRILNKQTVHKKDKEKSDGFISRHAGGLCFDVWDHDKSIYLCGTEEGFIHKCSVSYNEQYLFTYQGHTGPIYKLAWSPFVKNVFLSASGDWTMKLWKSDRPDACLTFNSSSKPVYDICWSQTSATVFCCVNETGFELWDLSKSTLDPILVNNTIQAGRLNLISYVPSSNTLIVGTNDGSLHVYAVKNSPPATTGDTLENIIKQSLISQLENIGEDDEESNEAIEKHQLESHKQLEIEENDDQQKKAQLDAFEAKIDKIKKDHEDGKGKSKNIMDDKMSKLLEEKKKKDTEKSQKSKSDEEDDDVSSNDD